VKRWIAIGGAVLAVAVVLVVLGVGGEGGKTVPSSTIAQAAAATASGPGYRMRLNGTMTSPALPRALTMRGDGAVDMTNKRARITLTVSGAPGANRPLQVNQVFDRRFIYLEVPGADLPGGNWAKMDLRRAQRQMGIDLQQGGIGMDPSQALDQLRATSGRVEELGRERVRGVETTHYRAVVELRRYPNLLPPKRRAAARAGVERLIRMAGAERFPQEVWIDGRRRIRRLALDFNFELPSPAGKQRIAMKMTQDLFAFGKPVRVSVPEDATDVTKAAGKGLGSG